jgi:hypothetical protein
MNTQMKPDRPTLRLKAKPAPTVPAPTVTVNPAPAVAVRSAPTVTARLITAVRVKPAPAVAVKAVKPAPAKKAVKPAKPILEKERIRLENIRLNAEGYERRRLQVEKAKPLFDAYFADKPALRETVLIDGVECLRPLMIATRKTIFTFFKAHPDLQDLTNTVIADLISEALKAHVAKPQYAAGLVKFNERFDLDGNPVDAISEKHKATAIKSYAGKAPGG